MATPFLNGARSELIKQVGTLDEAKMQEISQALAIVLKIGNYS
ncbi:MAG: hypothetical protein ACKPCM_00725 [Pseudanabaena sp.]